MNLTTKNRVTELLGPVIQTLPPDAARRMIDVTADESLQDRIAYLAERANEGELTSDERAEYESIVDAGDIVAALQAIARRSLEQPATSK